MTNEGWPRRRPRAASPRPDGQGRRQRAARWVGERIASIKSAASGTSAHFSAVGFPGAIRRFARLDCYDRVHPALLPSVLRDENPTGAVRLVDGTWTDRPIGTP